MKQKSPAPESDPVDPKATIALFLCKLHSMVELLDPAEPNGTAISAISKALQDLSLLHAKSQSKPTSLNHVPFSAE